MHFKMSFAICFSLDQSKVLLSGNGLNFCLKEKKIITGNRENTGYQHFLPFPQCIQFGPSRKFVVW